ncbi:group III truncated hemoglobin [Amantichitinum ursilacus]|nr:group III truncated hemoglobin [Amantichitinum ursilacus]
MHRSRPAAGFLPHPHKAITMQAVAQQIGQAQVRAVVTEFYSRVRAHPELGVPFQRVSDWPHHLDILTHFWWVTLGGEKYLGHRYEVTERHLAAGFTPALLDIWLALFTQTAHEMLPTEMADAWLERAQRIGKSLRILYVWQQDPTRADREL